MAQEQIEVEFRQEMQQIMAMQQNPHGDAESSDCKCK